MQKIAVLVGSLRQQSANLRFAKALEKLADSRLQFTYPEIGDLPLYNDDLWAAPPASVIRLKREIEDADAVLFVTPEYLRNIPSVLSNAIFWAARPYGQNSFADKPGAIVGTSPGVIGSAVAQSHLRAMIPGIEVILMGQPEVYFQSKAGLIDDEFNITEESARTFLAGWVNKFENWVERHSAARAMAAE
jgi:chromate reductase